MYRSLLGLAVVVAGLAYPPTSDAMLIMPQPGPTRVVNSDAIIVGKVIALEPQDVQAQNVTYRIAIVQIDDAIRGIKDGKTVRVGFIPPPMNVKGPLVGKFRSVQLQVGQEGLFLLARHQKEGFYTLGGPVGYFIVNDQNAAFDKEVKAVKAVLKVVENPMPALKSKDADERLLGAAVLIEKYRTYKGGAGEPKLEPIDAAESKLILLALADADWQALIALGSMRPNPSNLFGRLGINQKDGFIVPPGANYLVAAQTWLRQNADTYRIQRFADTSK